MPAVGYFLRGMWEETMKYKNIIIIVIGVIVIMLIMVGVSYLNLKQTRQEIKVLNTVILKKNIDIEKLTKQLAAKQEELNGVKTELGNANKKLDNIRKEVDNTAKKPIASPPKAVKK